VVQLKLNDRGAVTALPDAVGSVWLTHDEDARILRFTTLLNADVTVTDIKCLAGLSPDVLELEGCDVNFLFEAIPRVKAMV
jgi:hypothetical protein